MKLVLSILILFVWIDSNCQDFELVPYRNKSKWGFADSTGKIKIKTIYKNVIPFNRGFAAFKLNEKWGFIDVNGNEILKERYDSVGNYFQGYYVYDKATKKRNLITGLQVFIEGKEIYVDINGKNIFGDKGPDWLTIVDIDEERIDNYKNKIEIFKNNEKFGFKIKKDDFTSETLYDSLIYSDTDLELVFGEQSDPYFLAKRNGKWGVINTKNIVLLDFDFDELKEYQFDGVKLFKKNGKWGILDKNFSVKLNNVYDSLVYNNGTYLVKQNDKWAIFDYKYNEILPFKFKDISITPDKQGYYVQDENAKYGYYNKKGVLEIPIKYTYIQKFKFRNDFKYREYPNNKYVGLLNVNNKIIIEAKYDDIFPFENGYALVIKNGKYGYINKDGYEFFKK
jgi:hypothetical protein